MERSRLAWFLCLPIAAIGGLTAHLVAYSLLSPAVHSPGGHAHAAAAHVSGGAHLRACLFICVALLLLSTVACVVRASVRGRALSVPVWLFALLPPGAFLLQDSLEALSLPIGLTEPGFLVGLLVQLPFAAAAYLLARAVLSAVRRFVRRSAPARPRLTPFFLTWLPVAAREPWNPSVLSLGHGQRAPPLLST
jgi:hypothetical protein